MPVAIYIWKSPFPWDVRAEKICRALASKGFSVYMLARHGGESRKREKISYSSGESITVIRAGFGKSPKASFPLSFNPLWKKELTRLCDEVNPDILIPRDIYLTELAGWEAKRRGIPMVIDMAENYPEAMRGWKKYARSPIMNIIVHKLRYPDSMEKKGIKLSAGFIAVADENAERIIRQYGYSPGDTEIVHNTPKLEWFENTKPGPKTPPQNFAYHGHLSLDRNLDTMVKAFTIAARKDKDIFLEIAGDGENLNELKDIARRESCGRIDFLGKFRHSDLGAMLSRADIGILPYNTNDFINTTISNKLFDYMAAGKPVIVSLSPPMARIVNEANCGLAVDCSDEKNLAKAFLEIKRMDLKQMSESGMRFAKEKYNWEVDSKKLIEFIQRFI